MTTLLAFAFDEVALLTAGMGSGSGTTIPMPGQVTATLLASGLHTFPESSLTIMAGDVPALLDFLLTDAGANGQAVDLTGVLSVSALLYLYELAADGTMQDVPVWTASRLCTISTPATLGTVTLSSQIGDFALAGAYRLYLQIAYPGGALVTTATPISIYVDAFTP